MHLKNPSIIEEIEMETKNILNQVKIQRIKLCIKQLKQSLKEYF